MDNASPQVKTLQRPHFANLACGVATAPSLVDDRHTILRLSYLGISARRSGIVVLLSSSAQQPESINWNVNTNRYDVGSVLHPLHSNCDCCALVSAAFCNSGGPLTTTADSTLPSWRTSSINSTSPVMCAVRGIGGYTGSDNFVRTTTHYCRCRMVGGFCVLLPSAAKDFSSTLITRCKVNVRVLSEARSE